MKQRCYNPNNPGYKWYGGRGITVCPQWLARGTGFETFLQDMGARPGPEYSIERRRVNDNYEPSNCYWATPDKQNNNTRRNIFLEHDGKRLTMQQWSEETGIPYDRLHARYRYGWSVEDILRTEKGGYTKDRKLSDKQTILTFEGETLNLSQWSRRLGIDYEVLRSRHRYGWSTERILTTPVIKRNKPESS